MNIFIIIALAAALWFVVGTYAAPKKRFLIWATGSVTLAWYLWPHMIYLRVHP